MNHFTDNIERIILHTIPRISILASAILAMGLSCGASAADKASTANPFKAGPAATSLVVSSSMTSAGPLVVFSGLRSGYTITANGSLVTVLKKSTGATSSHAGPIRFQFSDRNVAWNNWTLLSNTNTDYIDADGPAQLYRLYDAAFGRKPDLAGLGYWIKVRDSGTFLRDIASGMADSAEMGVLSDADFISKVYYNVNLTPISVAERDRWVSNFKLWRERLFMTPSQARGNFLSKYSEFEWHRVRLDPEYRNGIDYIPN